MIDLDSPEFKIGQFIRVMVRRVIIGGVIAIAGYYFRNYRNSNNPFPENPSFNK